MQNRALLHAAPRHGGQRPELVEQSSTRPRILLVDDEPDLRDILRTALERAGHRVTDAAGQEQAMATVRAWPPDLVVTDMRMPVTGGGVLIRRLRADPLTAGIPILATCADSGIAAGADIALPSLYSRDQVLSAINALLSPVSGAT